MNLKLDRRFLPLILVLLGIPCHVCQNNEAYRTCSEPFKCGRLDDIRYPFYGGSRPLSCGYRGFQLDCREDDDPLMTSASILYRVINVDNSTPTVKVSRDDLWGTLCPPTPPTNTSLDFTLFDFYSLADDRNMTIFYGCSAAQLSLPSQFTCNQNVGSNFFTASSFLDPAIRCNNRISVRVNQSAALELENINTASTSLLEGALKGGFTIEWSADNNKCRDCSRSGGVCGYNETSSSFACHCPDATFESTCNRNNNGSKSSSSLKIGLPIVGAVLAGAAFVWLVFYCRKQRIQRLASLSTQTTNKNISTPPSSNKPFSMPKFSKSIPSYPSSKSDLGRGSTYFGAQVFDYTELEEATDHFNPSRELGDGGFGTVYYGMLSDGREVAVKFLYENNFRRVEQFMNEVEILTGLRHANLVTLYGCTSKRSQQLLLVYEYIANGTVADHLNGNRSKSGLLSWPVRLNIAIETAEALAYLHKKEVIHRDVKTNNILLDRDFHVKVADFGLSRLFPNNVTHVSTAPQGTPGYVDPEYYQCYQLTEKSDVYSFGVVLVELMSSLPAVDTSRHRHDINLSNMAVNKIQNHALHELVDPSLGFETSSTVRRMITLVAELAFRCLQQETDMRPSMEEVLESLKIIQNEDLNAHKVEILIDDDEAGLLKGSVSPPSPDSAGTEKSGRGSTTNSSSLA